MNHDTPTELYPGPFGLVSDAHGNPIGLRACIDLLRRRGARTIFFLGDAVGYLPLVGNVMQMLSEIEAVCVAGNHEAMLLGLLPNHDDDIFRLNLARARLSADELSKLASWPIKRIVADRRLPRRRLLLLHGSPRDPLRAYVHPDSDMSFIDPLNVKAIACGHTHRPFIARRKMKFVVNCGSAGLPRDIGGSASCAFLDLRELNCEIHRTSFDVQRLLDDCGHIEQPHSRVVAVLRRVNGQTD
jgi:predicted phosphodiesterase